MASFKVRVEGGKLVGTAPPGLPEGTELEVSVADPGDDMTEEELAELNRALEAAWQSVQKGDVRPAEEAIARLRKKG